MLRKGLLKDYQDILKRLFKSTDICIIFVVFYLYYFVKFGTFEVRKDYFYFIIFSLILFYFLGMIFDLYKIWRGEAILAEVLRLTTIFAIFSSLLTTVLFLIKAGSDFSREWLFVSLSCVWVILCGQRFFLRYLLMKFRQMGFNQRHICSVVIDEKALRLYKKICTESAAAGINLETVFSDNILVANENSYKGKIDGIKEYLKSNNPDQIWIFGSLQYESIINNVIGFSKDKPIPIRYIPDLSSLKLLNHSISQIAGFTVLNIQDPPINTVSKVVFKRLEDIVLSLIFIIIFSPVYLFIAIIIKLTSNGPIFYRQIRVSYNNKPFYILKFRSMPVDIEKKTGAVWAKEGENRATKFGSFLRKTSLDEIPQFFNVLKGDMSIVGPRPERPKFVRVFKEQVPDYMKKHMVRAGITGWAQVHGWRGNTDIHKRIEYDLYYINNWSLWFDIRIIFMTLIRGLINKNAY